MQIFTVPDVVRSFAKRLWLACLPERKRAIYEYEQASIGMAVAYSYCYIGYDAERYAGYILRWAAAEANYASLGYRPIGLWTLVVWLNCHSNDKLPIGVKRENGETAIFYARNYFDLFGKSGICTPEDGPTFEQVGAGQRSSAS